MFQILLSRKLLKLLVFQVQTHVPLEHSIHKKIMPVSTVVEVVQHAIHKVNVLLTVLINAEIALQSLQTAYNAPQVQCSLRKTTDLNV